MPSRSKEEGEEDDRFAAALTLGGGAEDTFTITGAWPLADPPGAPRAVIPNNRSFFRGMSALDGDLFYDASPSIFGGTVTQ